MDKNKKIISAFMAAEESRKLFSFKDKSGIKHEGTVEMYCSPYENDDGKAGICFNESNGEKKYITEDEVSEIL